MIFFPSSKQQWSHEQITECVRISVCIQITSSASCNVLCSLVLKDSGSLLSFVELLSVYTHNHFVTIAIGSVTSVLHALFLKS